MSKSYKFFVNVCFSWKVLRSQAKDSNFVSKKTIENKVMYNNIANNLLCIPLREVVKTIIHNN